MNVQRLDHVVFAVQELEAAARAWADTFGLQAEPVALPEGIPLQLSALAVGAPDGPGAFLELAAARQEPALSEVERESPIASHIEQWGEGMLSISLQVDDLDAAVRELRAKGVTVADPAPGLLPHDRTRPEPGAARPRAQRRAVEGARPRAKRRVARIDRESAFGVAVQLIERGSPSS